MYRNYGAMGVPWSVIIDASGTVRANSFFVLIQHQAVGLIEALRKETKKAAPKK